ncbi:unnamed protein product [Arabidopsis arenosa]|uniref:Uncharacterized protein n=1 Tax=Arabidopsis arenosa TaxID=38785 RepID=A0A8S2B4S1_ARAAE|nr:unnamed protein product [Arabidopsis arenosa]
MKVQISEAEREIDLVSGSGNAEGECGREVRAVGDRSDGEISQVKFLCHFFRLVWNLIEEDTPKVAEINIGKKA